VSVTLIIHAAGLIGPHCGCQAPMSQGLPSVSLNLVACTVWSQRNARHMLQLRCFHVFHRAARSMERCLSSKPPSKRPRRAWRVLQHHDCALCRAFSHSTGRTRDVHADPGFGLSNHGNADPYRERQAVIGLLDAEVVPLLRKCSLAGHAEYKTHNEASTSFMMSHVWVPGVHTIGG